jgi:hypothetical protein
MSALVATQVAPAKGAIAITVNAAGGGAVLAGAVEPALLQPVEKARRSASKDVVESKANVRCIMDTSPPSPRNFFTSSLM